MSAEKNTSNGAPFWICAKKFPDEPNDTSTVCRVSRSKRAVSTGRTDCRSEAAATRSRAWASAPGATRAQQTRRRMNRLTIMTDQDEYSRLNRPRPARARRAVRSADLMVPKLAAPVSRRVHAFAARGDHALPVGTHVGH